MMKVERRLTESGPELVFPKPFNVAAALVDRHLVEGRATKAAIRTADGDISYGALAADVNRFGNAVLGLGVLPGERLLMVVKDCPEFFYTFLGCVKAGVIAVPLNTMLRAADYRFIIEDSGCAALVYSDEFAAEVEAGLNSAARKPARVLRVPALADIAAGASDKLEAVQASEDAPCFWLYSSGTTGKPKGVVHVHRDIVAISQLYAVDTLGAEEGDTFFSIPRLFFAYGLGCGMTFPLWVGGTAVLDPRRPTPQTVAEVITRFKPTVFAAVPTFYAAFLASGTVGKDELAGLRRCVSGGEALPPDLQRRWGEIAPAPILDGIGSTEALHIYISNRLDDIRPGASGKPVGGYSVRITVEGGRDAGVDEPGRLWVKGPSLTRQYWNNPERTATCIVDGWLDTGDTYRRDAEGYYYYCGRSDDMLKVGGIWVSPFEIESALLEHPKVLEAAVVGRADESTLVKPEAWIVLRRPADASDKLADDIRQHCRERLAPYKYPRWVHFIEELPKTATGKIQRFRLRSAQ